MLHLVYIQFIFSVRYILFHIIILLYFHFSQSVFWWCTVLQSRVYRRQRLCASHTITRAVMLLSSTQITLHYSCIQRVRKGLHVCKHWVSFVKYESDHQIDTVPLPSVPSVTAHNSSSWSEFKFQLPQKNEHTQSHGHTLADVNSVLMVI